MKTLITTLFATLFTIQSVYAIAQEIPSEQACIEYAEADIPWNEAKKVYAAAKRKAIDMRHKAQSEPYDIYRTALNEIEAAKRKADREAFDIFQDAKKRARDIQNALNDKAHDEYNAAKDIAERGDEDVYSAAFRKALNERDKKIWKHRTDYHNSVKEAENILRASQRNTDVVASTAKKEAKDIFSVSANEATVAYEAAMKKAEADLKKANDIRFNTYLAIFVNDGGVQSKVRQIMVKRLKRDRQLCREVDGI